MRLSARSLDSLQQPQYDGIRRMPDIVRRTLQHSSWGGGELFGAGQFDPIDPVRPRRLGAAALPWAEASAETDQFTQVDGVQRAATTDSFWRLFSVGFS